jgi:hypothetical protein
VNLTDSESIRNAIKTNGACQACHATLDPLASHLWGFVAKGDDPITWSLYKPQEEDVWDEVTGVAPGFFGAPTTGTARALAEAIVSDSRFSACATRRVYEAFLGRSAGVADQGQLALHREAFVASGLSLKALVKSVVADQAYRGAAKRSARGGDPEPVIVKLIPPEILASELTDLSGYAMTFEGRGALRVDSAMRALAGGSDHGAEPSPSAGHALAHRRIAEASARALVEGRGTESRVGALLATEDRAIEPTTATLAALILEVRSRSVEETSADVRDLLSVWRDVASATGDAGEAWTAVLTALFADPDLATY